MIATSRMSGTSSMVVRPAASSAAAMSLRALFFAPVTRTRPVRAVPPVTSKHSTGSPYGGPAAGSRREPRPAPAGARREPASGGGGGVLLLGSGHDRPADPHLHEDRSEERRVGKECRS